MSIALYIDKCRYGGGQRVLITLANEFVKKGLETVVFTSDNNFDLSIVSCDVVFIDNKGSKIKQLVQIYKGFKKYKVSKIIVFWLNSLFFIASFLTNSKYIYSLRNDPQTINFNKFSYKFILNHCSRIVFQTTKIQSMFDLKVIKKSCVIPNPILDQSLPEVAKSREKKIVVVARLSKEKNISMALHAFNQIDRHGYKLHIYGTGDELESLKSLTKSLGLEEEVFFEGYINKAVDYIQNAEILLLTSNEEGMPNALIEGMAMGLACICTDLPSGAAQDLIKDDFNGYIIPLNDADSLARKIEILINNETKRHLIQLNASQIRKRLDVKPIVDTWLDNI